MFIYHAFWDLIYDRQYLRRVLAEVHYLFSCDSATIGNVKMLRSRCHRHSRFFVNIFTSHNAIRQNKQLIKEVPNPEYINANVGRDQMPGLCAPPPMRKPRRCWGQYKFHLALQACSVLSRIHQETRGLSFFESLEVKESGKGWTRDASWFRHYRSISFIQLPFFANSLNRCGIPTRPRRFRPEQYRVQQRRIE